MKKKRKSRVIVCSLFMVFVLVFQSMYPLAVYAVEIIKENGSISQFNLEELTEVDMYNSFYLEDYNENDSLGNTFVEPTTESITQEEESQLQPKDENLQLEIDTTIPLEETGIGDDNLETESINESTGIAKKTKEKPSVSPKEGTITKAGKEITTKPEEGTTSKPEEGTTVESEEGTTSKPEEETTVESNLNEPEIKNKTLVTPPTIKVQEKPLLTSAEFI